jgi:2-amino-4-hydroxy-6-hydroxymethyldihydropteridine diphosphokinase
MTVRAIVSLGSNLGDRARSLADATAALAALPGTRLVAESEPEETDPVDVPPEFANLKFLNKVAVFETSLGPEEFSVAMHKIEDSLGRVRTVRNGPRTIDIDLVDFGGIEMATPSLTLPHPRARERAFVTEPLARLGVAF